MMERIQKWGRTERTHPGAMVLHIVSGKAIIQCEPFAPEGRHFKPGDSNYYISPESRVLVIAVEATEIEWKPAVMLGFGGSVSKQLAGGAV